MALKMDWSLFNALSILLFSGLTYKLFTWKKSGHKSVFRNLMVGLGLSLVFFLGGFTGDKGWPSNKELPDEFVFIHGVVQPPKGDYEGDIYLWIRHPAMPKEPLSIKVPYDKELADQVIGANLLVAQHGEVIIKLTDLTDPAAKASIEKIEKEQQRRTRKSVII